MEELDKPKVSITAIVISTVLAAVVFGGGVYAYQNNKANKDKEVLKSQITTLETEKANLEKQVADSTSTTTTTQNSNSATTTTDETASWKTYSNSELKYSIKYPTDWLLDTQSIKDNYLYLLTNARKQKIDAGQIVRVFDVSVKVYETSSELPNNQTKKLSFENWIKQEADGYGFIQRKSVVVDGVTGYQGIGSGDGESYLIFVQEGDFIYQLETGGTTTPTSIEQKVINSFKFL